MTPACSTRSSQIASELDDSSAVARVTKRNVARCNPMKSPIFRKPPETSISPHFSTPETRDSILVKKSAVFLPFFRPFFHCFSPNVPFFIHFPIHFSSHFDNVVLPFCFWFFCTIPPLLQIFYTNEP